MMNIRTDIFASVIQPSSPPTASASSSQAHKQQKAEHKHQRRQPLRAIYPGDSFAEGNRA
jgi:hypothetical protein